MADRISIESTFDGTCSFICYGKLDNDKKTPYIAYRCTDSESGKEAEGKLFCSEKALPYTVKKLKAVGVEGDSDREVLANAAQMSDAECTFDTIDNDGYINADNLRAAGSTGGGGGGSITKHDFLESVFGVAAESKAEDKGGDDNVPF